MAKERHKWRRLVIALKDGHRTAGRQVTRTARFTIRVTQNPNPTSKATAAAAYRTRDAHEAFFRPKATSTYNKKQTRPPKHSKALTRPRALTDKQRRAWAREHYELHYQFPAIMGHHRHYEPDRLNQTLLPPPTTHSLLQYLDELE